MLSLILATVIATATPYIAPTPGFDCRPFPTSKGDKSYICLPIDRVTATPSPTPTEGMTLPMSVQPDEEVPAK